jgi:inositol oxygenase
MRPASESVQRSPLSSVDEWDTDVRQRYPQPAAEHTSDNEEGHTFRNYDDEGTPARVREFYRQNHRGQTVDFVRSMHAKYLPLRQRRMSVWEAIDCLNALVDTSDPDTELPQIEHALQTAEAIRADGHPRWFVLVGMIHDLGKVLCLFGEPQWAVVGDTFPVGCAWSEKIVLSRYFDENPDRKVSEYQTKVGIYEEGIGLDRVLMSWGHDEYLYHVVKDRLPTEALYMLRYHSFYPAHRENEYGYLMNDQDRTMFDWVRRFNPYDLYTKTDRRPDVAALMPFYRDLVDEYLPGELQW